MNRDTRLSVALAAHPDVLEYIISLNPHDFERLRNPLLRKVMPVRITLGRIAAMVKMPEAELIEKIHEIAGIKDAGEHTDDRAETTNLHSGVPLPQSSSEPPKWMWSVDPEKIEWVDVTPIDRVLGDPMPPINIAVNKLAPGQTVGIKHQWEPQPLFDIWQSRGLQFWSHQEEPDLWHVFVHKPG